MSPIWKLRLWLAARRQQRLLEESAAAVLRQRTEDMRQVIAAVRAAGLAA